METKITATHEDVLHLPKYVQDAEMYLLFNGYDLDG